MILSRAVVLLAPAVLLHLATPARAQDATPAEPPAPTAPADPTPPLDAPTPDPAHARREALFDLAFDALASGRLSQAEQAFDQAAALPGDPVRAAVARSFLERVRRLRAQRQRARAAQLAARAAAPPPAQSESDEGARPAFLATTTVLGLTAWGWLLPLAVGADSNPRAFVGLYLVTVGSSFLLPFLATGNRHTTPGEANLAFYGATRGLWHGLLFASIFAGDVNPNDSRHGWAASVLLGSVGEMAAGYAVAGAADLTAGEARTIAVGGDFGLGLGFATGALLGLHHDDRSADAQARGMAAAGFLGASIGLAGGALLAKRRENTWGDGEVLRAAGLLGTFLGVTTDVLFDWDPSRTQDEKKAFLSLMAGGALGLWAGDRLVSTTDFSVGESIQIDLATVAGALGAAGVFYLAAGGSGVNARAITTISAAGGLLGFGLSYAYVSEDARARAGVARRGEGLASGVALVPAFGSNGTRGLALAGTF